MSDFLPVQKGTPPSEAADKRNNQPHIVLFQDELEDEDLVACKQYFISVEQKLFMESSNLITALLNLVASHYILNLAYHLKTNDMLTFLQEEVMDIASDGKKLTKPSSSVHVSGIVRYYKAGSTDND